MLDLKSEYEYMKKDVDAAIADCLEHQRWIFGPEVKELEDKVAEYLGVKHCIGASSGTEALVLSLRALAIKTKGQEYFDKSDGIITTPFTFTATGDAILRSGGTPVYVDIDPETYNVNVDNIRNYLKENGSKVVGILPVHLYGQSCDMDGIMSVANEHGLFVVEDIAQAFGGAWRDRKLGSAGTAGAFSFFPSKNLGGFGDGGMVSTDDNGIAELVRMLLKHGGKDKYNVDHIGYNARLDTIQAAVVLAKFKYIDAFNGRRRKIAEQYAHGLSGIKELTLPFAIHNAQFSGIHHVFHQYTVRTSRRDDLQGYLKENGIASMVYYPVPLHQMNAFSGRMKIHGELPEAEKAAREVLSLPIGPLQEDDITHHIIRTVKSFFS